MTWRAEQRAARRALPEPLTPSAVLESRKEAHRVLRIARGAHAAQYVAGPVTAVVEPFSEFASPVEWRRWLEPLFPLWAVDIGVRLYEPDRTFVLVTIEPDAPPHRRWVPADRRIDLRFYASRGQVDRDGLWLAQPGEPLPDVRPAGFRRQARGRDVRGVDDVRDRPARRPGQRWAAPPSWS